MSASEPRVRGLLAWQWGLTLGSVVGVVGIAGATWGAWLPVGAYLVGTALWGWSADGRSVHASRTRLKRVALAAGWRGASGFGVAFVVLRAVRSDLFEMDGAASLAVGLLIATVGTPILTAMSLVGLDAARGDETARKRTPGA